MPSATIQTLMRGDTIPAKQIGQAKACLRRHLLARRAALTSAEIDHKSAAIAAYVCALPVFEASRTLMVYLSLPQEVQTAVVIEEARRLQKRIVVPAVTERGLVAVECPADAAQLRRSPLGILEPCEVSAPVPPAEIDCVLVPGIGFDRRGTRLGFGKGYYDRFLSQLSAAACYGGIAFHTQIIPCVPCRPHDVSMLFVVTEQGVLTWGHVLPASQGAPHAG